MNQTERESKFGEAFAHFDKLSENIPGVIYQFLMSPDGRTSFPFASGGMLDIYGISPEEVREDATRVFSRIHPDDLTLVNDTILQSMKELSVWQCDYRVVLPDRGLRWVSGQSKPERLPDGSTLWHGYIRDVTDRVQADEVAKAERMRLQNTIEAANIGTWEWIVETNEIIINDIWAQLLGYSLEEVHPMNIEKFRSMLHPEEFDEILAGIDRYFSGDDPIYDIVFRLRHKQGHWVWIHSRGKIVGYNEDGSPKSVYGTHIDITERMEVEKELRESQELLDVFFAQSLTGFFFMMLDEPVDWNGAKKEDEKAALVEYALDHHRITRVNQAMLDQYGIAEQDLLKATARHMFQHDEDEARRVWRRLFDEGKLHVKTNEMRADGTPIIIEGDYICLYDDEGRITGHFGVQHDVTTEQELQRKIKESEEYHRTLKNSIPDLFFVTDYDGVYLDFKAEAASLYADPAFFLGKSYKEVMPAYLVSLFEPIFERTIRTGEVEECIYDLEIDGQTKHFQARIVAFGGNKIINFVRDITALKSYEAQLEEARNKAELANQAKSRFLANMSHEIRTPLNGVIGFTDLLRRTNLDVTQQLYVENANTAGIALLEIINNILDVSKIEAGKLELELGRHDIVELCVQAIDIVRYQASQKGLEMYLIVAPTVPRYARLDSVRLRQVLMNLLGNAVKFTEKGEVILKLDFTAGKRNGMGTYHISVQDTGIGIGEAQFDKLFKAFSQADPSINRRYGGTGLGLLISDLLVKKMGSSIGLESTPGKGSTFFFDVSTQCEPGEPAIPSEPVPVNKVLLIDDSATQRRIMTDLLGYWGIDLITAENGMEGLILLNDHPEVDFIIMDFNMPYLNGIEVARKIRAKETRRIPILLLHSISDDSDLAETCRDASICLSMSKPIKAALLHQMLMDLEGYMTRFRPGQHFGGQVDEPAEVVTHSQNPFVVLIAEDIAMNMILTKTLVQQIIGEVTILEATDGIQVLDLMRKHTVDLILMDVQMPGMDGLLASRGVREMEQGTGRRVPIVALTAGALSEERDRCLDAGMDDFLAKPIELQSLRSKVVHYLKQPTGE